MKTHSLSLYVLLPFWIAVSHIPSPAAENTRVRARDIGIVAGDMTPGHFNAITDVHGVAVGHRTIIKSDNIRTGVTAILPHSGNIFREKVSAAIFIGNGFSNGYQIKANQDGNKHQNGHSCYSVGDDSFGS